MPRKRMIDPSFWRDEKISQCSYMERLLFIGLWTFSEDNGVGRANPLLIKADVFPYETLREADIDRSLAKFASLGMLQLYELCGQKYYYIVNFLKYQSINKPTPPTLPLPPPERSRSTPGVLPTEYKLKEVKLKEVKLKEVNICTEPESVSMPPVITLMLNNGTEYPVTQEYAEQMAALYPAVDIKKAWRDMKAWCINNPTKRKTKSGITRFINAWLSKEQDKGGVSYGPVRNNPTNAAKSAGDDGGTIEVKFE